MGCSGRTQNGALRVKAEPASGKGARYFQRTVQKYLHAELEAACEQKALAQGGSKC